MGIKKCIAEKLFGRYEGGFLHDIDLDDIINRVLVLKGLMLGGYTDLERCLELQQKLRRIGYMGEETLHDMEEFLIEKISYELLNSDLASRLTFLHVQPRKYCMQVAENLGIELDDYLESMERSSDGRRSVEERCARGEFDSIF